MSSLDHSNKAWKSRTCSSTYTRLDSFPLAQDLMTKRQALPSASLTASGYDLHACTTTVDLQTYEGNTCLSLRGQFELSLSTHLLQPITQGPKTACQ